MLFNVSYVEWFGYLGSVIVAVSLTMSSIKKLRWYNFVGAAIFSIYGFVIWLKLYYAIISTVAHDSDKRLPHNMPDNKLLLCE